MLQVPSVAQTKKKKPVYVFQVGMGCCGGRGGPSRASLTIMLLLLRHARRSQQALYGSRYIGHINITLDASKTWIKRVSAQPVLLGGKNSTNPVGWVEWPPLCMQSVPLQPPTTSRLALFDTLPPCLQQLRDR